MSYQYIDGINMVLRRVSEINTDITSFIDSQRQVQIDVARQSWKETILDVYQDWSAPVETSTATITLVAGTKEYALPEDLENFSGQKPSERVMVNTDGFRIFIDTGGYTKLFANQTDPSDWTGQATAAVVNTTNGKLRLNFEPTSNEAGRVFSYLYDKRIQLVGESDPFPFRDSAVDALVEAVSQRWERVRKQRFDQKAYNKSISLGISIVRKDPPKRKYG